MLMSIAYEMIEMMQNEWMEKERAYSIPPLSSPLPAFQMK
jgi:hypothetical protein